MGERGLMLARLAALACWVTGTTGYAKHSHRQALTLCLFRPRTRGYDMTGPRNGLPDSHFSFPHDISSKSVVVWRVVWGHGREGLIARALRADSA